MTAIEDPLAPQVGRLQVPRTRGAVSGVLLVLLGAWGALAPFVGPYFDFGFGADRTWVWTSTRGWLEVLPGAAVGVGGLLLLVSAHRVIASLGGWLAAAGGAWFVIGLSLADLLHIGSIGAPIDTGTGHESLEYLAFFSGLGVLVVFIAAGAVGRLSVRSVRDIRAAQRHARTDPRDPALAEDATPLTAQPTGVPPYVADPYVAHPYVDTPQIDGSTPRHFERRDAAPAPAHAVPEPVVAEPVLPEPVVPEPAVVVEPYPTAVLPVNAEVHPEGVAIIPPGFTSAEPPDAERSTTRLP